MVILTFSTEEKGADLEVIVEQFQEQRKTLAVLKNTTFYSNKSNKCFTNYNSNHNNRINNYKKH